MGVAQKIEVARHKAKEGSIHSLRRVDEARHSKEKLVLPKIGARGGVEGELPRIPHEPIPEEMVALSDSMSGTHTRNVSPRVGFLPDRHDSGSTVL